MIVDKLMLYPLYARMNCNCVAVVSLSLCIFALIACKTLAVILLTRPDPGFLCNC